MTYDPDDTLPPGPSSDRPVNPDTLPVLALVLVRSELEPERVGEAAFIPFEESRVVGLHAGEDFLPAEFGRQRLGPITEPRSPLAYTTDTGRPPAGVLFSRDDSLFVERLGPGSVRVRGEELEWYAEIYPGDTVTLDDQLVFVCVRRPPLMEARGVDAPYFGEADRAGVVGESPAAWGLRGDLALAAERHDHVLLLGEPGTGHAEVAAFVHRASRRAEGPFLSVDALPCLTEDPPFQLFGHDGHSISGELEPPLVGLIASADQGTLVLRDLGAVPKREQAYLSRVLDSGSFHPVLSTDNRERQSDLRIIATIGSSTDSLEHPILYRFPRRITLPSLRERPEDIPLLARQLLRKHAAASPEQTERFFGTTRHGGLEPRMSARLMEHLVQHPLPGNVEGLDALLLRALRTSTGREIELTAEVVAGGSGEGAAP
jgi:hypothetical protein